VAVLSNQEIHLGTVTTASRRSRDADRPAAVSRAGKTPSTVHRVLRFTPMPLARPREPFNHPSWLFELKYDGLRAPGEALRPELGAP
jgi:ATP-dependent DNA ligase